MFMFIIKVNAFIQAKNNKSVNKILVIFSLFLIKIKYRSFPQTKVDKNSIKLNIPYIKK